MYLPASSRCCAICFSLRQWQAGDRGVSAHSLCGGHAKYGSDKPDLRIPIEMQDVTPAFDGSDFKIFANMIAKDERVRVWAIPAKTGGSRAFATV